ncbi:hypothetical protein CFC21_028256 [Triticum aestivum]|uniref:Uncharacterized protein n=3 Tax=Triticum TaxID=4564 RepID=A0A1D5TKQ6_WHEAT|nr:hypothetical protein TRIUR3_01951 [Triticum urartu]KAF6999553.1 hypothetical protein CFC21_015562 [Triticum aestivum]KAF7014233.1 hypothetical protein CFC21_028250 [Triticum aestivum]KAF7014239.1 hypothetical protein CFC21_028256 [Triticum aestivum]
MAFSRLNGQMEAKAAAVLFIVLLGCSMLMLVSSTDGEIGRSGCPRLSDGDAIGKDDTPFPKMCIGRRHGPENVEFCCATLPGLPCWRTQEECLHVCP